MAFDKIIEREREMFYARHKISQKKDLVNQILQLCEESYITLEQFSKDFPNSTFDNLYGFYKDKIETLRGTLKEDKTLTEDINKTLQKVLENVKNLNLEKYTITKQSLKGLMDRTWN